MNGLGPEAVNAAFCTLFNYAVTQAWAWMGAKAEREVYDDGARRIETLQRLGVFARELHVRGEPGQAVRLGIATKTVRRRWRPELR